MCSTLGTVYTTATKDLSYPETQAKQSYSWWKKEDGLRSYDGDLRPSLHCTGKTGSTHFIKDKEEEILASIFSPFFFFCIYTHTQKVYLGPVKPAV